MKPAFWYGREPGQRLPFRALDVALIRSLNADIPWPQLVKEHIAGALLPPRLSADGKINEFEDNLMWRTADLLGVSSRDRIALRRRVAGEHAETESDGVER